jgi:hypothetical protein
MAILYGFLFGGVAVAALIAGLRRAAPHLRIRFDAVELNVTSRAGGSFGVQTSNIQTFVVPDDGRFREVVPLRSSRRERVYRERVYSVCCMSRDGIARRFDLDLDTQRGAEQIAARLNAMLQAVSVSREKAPYRG